MRDTYIEILRHSATYGAGFILARLASFFLLPVYTRYLRPADYGALALLDITANLLVGVLGTALVSGVVRHHFEAATDEDRSRLWFTGFTFIASVATALVLIAFLFRDPLTDFALGTGVSQGAYYVTLVLITAWFGFVGQLGDSYLRVRKWSGLYLVLSTARLALNIGLNLYLLVALEMGLAGILLGNLLTTLITTVAFSAILLANLRTLRVRSALLPDLIAFSSPLIVTALISLFLHDGDRYILRLFLTMDEVGIYSLAYLFGQGMSALLLHPFAAIWNVVLYELAPRSDARQIYAQVFASFAYAFSLVMFGVALASRVVVQLMVAPDYARAADIIPVVCLAYVLFSLHEHFRLPVMLAKRTSMMIPVFATAAAVNLAGNFLLIPRFGMAGAAWATVVAFFVFSFGGLARYRPLLSIPYPLKRFWLVLTGLTVSFWVHRLVSEAFLGLTGEILLGVALWTGWAVTLFGHVWPEIRSTLGTHLADVRS